MPHDPTDADELELEQGSEPRRVQDTYADFSPGPVPIAPDGGIAPGFAAGQPPAEPEATPENMVCLRGPCRHYWHVVTDAGEGNPEGTWEELGIPAPRMHLRVCTANPAREFELGGIAVYECNRWSPLEKSELDLLERLRAQYEESEPAEDPADLEDTGDTQ